MDEDNKYEWIENHLLSNYKQNLLFSDVEQFVADARAGREAREEREKLIFIGDRNLLQECEGKLLDAFLFARLQDGKAQDRYEDAFKLLQMMVKRLEIAFAGGQFANADISTIIDKITTQRIR